MLSEIKFETRTISYHGQPFTVRGAGLSTIAALLQSGARGDIEAAIQDMEAAYKSQKENPEDGTAIESSLASFAVKIPNLVATLIAICAGEPDSVAVVEQLPLSVQTEALLAIFYLTFDGEESLKNFVSGLKKLMASLTKSVKEAGQIAAIGTKA